MLNFIKNFLFDIKDLVITIAIISVLFFSVTWKINDTMNVNLTNPGDSGAILLNPDSTEENTHNPSGSNPLAEATEPSSEEPESQPPTEESTEASTETTPEATTSAPQNDSYVNFTVTQGEYGHTIAKHLVDAGLIDDARAFVIRANELGLDTKLREGKYKLKRSDGLDLIIKLLAGGSR